MPKVFTSEKQKIGETGEKVAAQFLMKQGFSIIETNYTKKWGEIDIVAEIDGCIHFVEVKSVTCRILPKITRETEEEEGNDAYRPEDNMHPWKLKRLSRTIQTYLVSNKVPEETRWQVDLAVVYLQMESRQARVKILPNIII